jgi:hypothetical protein
MMMIEPPDFLSPDAAKVFCQTLQKMQDPTPEQLCMLAAYAHAMEKARQTRKDRAVSRVWRGAAIYARNGLNLWPPLFIDYFDLLIDGEPALTNYLEDAWQIERPADYMTAAYNY